MQIEALPLHRRPIHAGNHPGWLDVGRNAGRARGPVNVPDKCAGTQDHRWPVSEIRVFRPRPPLAPGITTIGLKLDSFRIADIRPEWAGHFPERRFSPSALFAGGENGVVKPIMLRSDARPQ